MLSPYRVLDLCTERGQLTGMILADLGAEVTLVEPPGGSSARGIGPFAGGTPDPDRSLYFWAYNRNKRGLILDLTTAEGQQRLKELVRDADFLLESYDPGYLDTLGLGWEALRQINPRLVMVSLTPFGQSGPKAGWAASTLTTWAASGTLLITGDEDRPPVQVPFRQAYLHGAAEAAAAALIAHSGRQADGRGRHVDVSIQAAAMMATQSAVLTASWDGTQVGRVSGGVKLGPLMVRFVYPCKDGHVSVTFLFGTVIGPFTTRLFQWMHEEGFCDAATAAKDWVNYVPLLLSGQEPFSELMRCTAELERFTLSKTKRELFEAALSRGLLIVPVSTTEDVVNSPQLAARDYWTPQTSPDGNSYRYPGPFAKFSTSPIRFERPAPTLQESATAARQTTGTGAQPEQPAAVTPGGAAPSRLPLSGLKVLDFSWVFATPMGTRYLADWGATVIHVESSTRPDALRTYAPYKDGVNGPERSGQYANVQAGKLGLSLHMAHAEARDIALQLVDWADVVVESYSPKAMRAWGMDYESLRQRKPGLIMLSSCLNGQTGPQSFLAGFGTMGAQLAGFGALTGWPDRAPCGPFVAYTDYTSPKFVAAAILAAWDHRQRTGEGTYIDLSQAEAALHFLAPAFLDYTVNGHIAERMANRSPDFAPHGVYRCASNRAFTHLTAALNAPDTTRATWPSDFWVAIACVSDGQWQALCRATGHPEWTDDPRFATLAARKANEDALDALIGAWTAVRDVAEVESVLQAAGVPVHRAATSHDAYTDPQLRHRGHWQTVPHGELGDVVVESGRFLIDGQPSPPTWAGPLFGQHNEQVLKDILGLSDDQVVELIAAGALE